jgi:uncharacterized protein YcfL
MKKLDITTKTLYSILSLGMLLIITSFNDYDLKNTEWQLLQSNQYVEINYRYGDCELLSQGIYNENVYLQIINKVERKISVEWITEYWYNNKCIGCENNGLENHKTIILEAKQTVEGVCSEENDPNLKIFSKALKGQTTSKLSKFYLKNVQVVEINQE